MRGKLSTVFSFSVLSNQALATDWREKTFSSVFHLSIFSLVLERVFTGKWESTTCECCVYWCFSTTNNSTSRFKYQNFSEKNEKFSLFLVDKRNAEIFCKKWLLTQCMVKVFFLAWGDFKRRKKSAKWKGWKQNGRKLFWAQLIPSDCVLFES